MTVDSELKQRALYETRAAKSRRKTRIVNTTLISFAFLLALIYLIFYLAGTSIDNSAKTTDTLNAQMQKGMTEHLTKLENTAKIVFTQNSYTKYDATALESNKNSYASLQLEKEIKKYLSSLSLMDNYTDFAFVYRNNHTIGKVTQGTLDLYGDDFYEDLRDELGAEKMVWSTGFEGDYSRLYYIRNVNDNTIFIGSFYAEDLHTVFADSTEMNDLSVVLTDSQGGVIYSVNYSEATKKAVASFENQWTQNAVTTAKSSDYTASTSDCATGWHITTVMDTSGNTKMYGRVIVTCIGIMLAGILLAVIIRVFSTSFSDPDNLLFKAEFSVAPVVDSLTGLPTEDSVENAIADKIETCITGSTIALVLVRVANLKLIGENYGDEIVDEALKKVGGILCELFGESNIVGKTGHDEFIIFADYTEFNLFKSGERMRANLRQLESELEKCELDNSRGYVKCVTGVAVYPDDSADYDELYDKASLALAQNHTCQYYSELSDEIKQGGAEKQ